VWRIFVDTKFRVETYSKEEVVLNLRELTISKGDIVGNKRCVETPLAILV